MPAVLGGLAGALTALLVVAWAGAFGDEPTLPVAAPTNRVIERPVITNSGEVDRVAAVAARAVPSIVTVQISAFPGQNAAPTGSGSGVIFGTDGLILTNDHVIADAGEITVELSDGRKYPAALVGTDPVTDIAVLEIAASGLPAIDFANIDDVQIGDLAVAVGNPLGLEGGPSVTSGVVSAFNRELQVDPFQNITLFGLLQTDAPITRGSSGGALLDETGGLIGITTAIGVSDVGAEGLGFAVPVDMVDGVARDLIANGRVRHAFLGIEGVPAFTERDGVQVPIGAEITLLLPDSAIGAAGAQEGDIIISLEGRPVPSMNLLVVELRRYRADQEIEVGLLRDGRPLDITVTLHERPEN